MCWIFRCPRPTPTPPSPLLSADNATITFAAQKDGSLRVTYKGWEDAKIFRPGEYVDVHARGAGEGSSGGVPLPGPAPDPYREWEMTEGETVAYGERAIVRPGPPKTAEME